MNRLTVGINNWQEMVSAIAIKKVMLSGYLHTLLSASPAELPTVAFATDGRLKAMRSDLAIVRDYASSLINTEAPLGPTSYLFMLERRVDVVLIEQLIKRSLEGIDIFNRTMRAFVPVFSTIQFAECVGRGYGEFGQDPYPNFETSLVNLEECNDKFRLFCMRHGYLIGEALKQEDSRARRSVNVEQLLGEVDTLEIIHSWLVSLYKDLNNPSPNNEVSQNASNISELIDLHWDAQHVPAKDLVQATTQHYGRVLSFALGWIESLEIRLAKLLF
jgi:hypothetical protein